MHRIFSGRIRKPSSRHDSLSFLASLVAVTDSAPATIKSPENGSSNNIVGDTNSGGKSQDGEDEASSGSLNSVSNTTSAARLYANELINFYMHPGGSRNSNGHTLSDILRFPDRDLERHHDYIQWLFPLPEHSHFNPDAPQIDQLTAEAFRTRPELRDRMRESLVRMLAFYGFEVTPDGERFRVQEASNIDFQRKARFWLCRFDHNHLRITRIIRCLRVLGLEQEAAEFHRVLVRVATPRSGGRGVGGRTLMYWTRAAKRPLQVTPMDENFDDEVLKEIHDGNDSNGSAEVTEPDSMTEGIAKDGKSKDKGKHLA